MVPVESCPGGCAVDMTCGSEEMCTFGKVMMVVVLSIFGLIFAIVICVICCCCCAAAAGSRNAKYSAYSSVDARDKQSQNVEPFLPANGQTYGA
mmetsp:Transcript_17283/g.21816  ORF Transcript_17283/g.21816 Transcript_17283/m.21816 type:complete len:94 (-) Transcript_17283:300-581(-)